jgi:sucrose-6-phosphate hydrolase SacC (GH32 family)
LLALLCALVARNVTAADELFPSELVDFAPAARNPVFTAEGPGHWDVKIRERGWILREEDGYHLWFTGYDGPREGIKLLGYATSPDGLKWTRHTDNPVYRDGWVEDMMVVKQADTYYMFAEGRGDQAQLLTSKDRVHWTRVGPLDIRTTGGKAIPAPYGTPTVWFENGTWYLFYEDNDLGIWLARSQDLKVWNHVQDEPVIALGPAEYDKAAVALNQIIKHNGRYYACYHGSPGGERPYKWTSNLATSTDLVHWTKYSGNPVTSAAINKSSNLLILDGKSFRMYTMHDQGDVYLPRQARR